VKISRVIKIEARTYPASRGLCCLYLWW